ncbi:uncharacterized protein LOC8268733 [Ricinus communis]|uniref:Uncharacterized protein n=1 Tax=Ricinus communis TaxID=3988 RepID=B9S6Q9_RICCO|nr:uncharacterized protein LOC8268733 [Ricinus communis]EEF40665.1 conserved hypothetical protein [Ricinus communis]|eukprot:XP_002521678.1 uncharacterized protein LOC8268733 [Ricinus communis]
MLKKITMPPFSPKPTPSYRVRSISFPARSHPNIRRIEEELNKLSTSWNESSSVNAERVQARLTGLKEIYTCIESLLNLPLTQQALAQHQQEKWVGDMLDGLIRHLDVCSNTRDAILLMKESVRELQSALRRSKAGGELSIESNINAYFCSRKKMKKEAAKFLAALKQKANSISSMLNADDHYLAAVVKSLREANWVSISIFSSLLLFLSAPILKPKTSKWSLISKLVHKGVAASESQEENMNELENVDVALTNLLVPNSGNVLDQEEKVQSAQRMLEVLDISIEELENELECLFRHLIHTRVSLLNIVSHQLE